MQHTALQPGLRRRPRGVLSRADPLAATLPRGALLGADALVSRGRRCPVRSHLRCSFKPPRPPRADASTGARATQLSVPPSAHPWPPGRLFAHHRDQPLSPGCSTPLQALVTRVTSPLPTRCLCHPGALPLTPAELEGSPLRAIAVSQVGHIYSKSASRSTPELADTAVVSGLPFPGPPGTAEKENCCCVCPGAGN